MKTKDPEHEGWKGAKPSVRHNMALKEDLPARNEGSTATRFSRQADEALARSEQRFRALSEKSSDLIAIVDLQGVFRYVSPNTQSVLGYAAGELQGHGLFDQIHADERAAAQTLFAQCAAQPGAVRRSEVRFATRSGEWLWLETVATNLVDDPAVGGIVLNSRDVTGRRSAEEELRRASRALRALRNNSLAVVRAENESAYLREVCRIVKEDCGYAMVWVGFAEDDAEKSVRPVAWAGFEEGYLDTLKLTWADTDRGRGPTGTAIRTARVCRCLNMLTDPQFLPWREQAVKRGYASSIALPLMGAGAAFGALTIYARDPVGFADEEVKLLTELAGDFAYGIAMLRLGAAKERAEESLRTREARLRLALDAGRLGMWDWDISTGKVIWNDVHFRMLGYEPDSLSPTYQDWASRVHPEDLPVAEKTIRQAMDLGDDYESEFRACWPDGTVHWLEARGRFERDAGGRAIRNYGVMQDVTEHRLAERLSRALNAINAAIHSTPRAEQIMQGVITEAAQALGCDTAAVSLRRDNHWAVSHAHGFPENMIGTRMNDEDEPHALLAIQMQTPLAIDDAFTDRRVNRTHMKKWGVRSVLVIPLLVRRDAVGVLFFNYQRAPQVFGPVHLDFAAKLAAAVSLALENARLFADIKTELAERKKAEAARQESEERLRFALDACHIGAWDLDVVDHVAFRSPEHDHIFGYADPLPQWTYDMFLDHVVPEDRADVDADFGQATATGGLWDFECRIRRADGAIRWIWASGRHHTDPAGHGRLAGIVQDITDRKLAENALRERDERIQQALLVSRSFTFEWEPATDRVTRSKDCGPILRLKGDEAESDTGANFFQRVHAEDRDRFTALLQALTPDSATYQTQYRIVCPDGEVVVLEEAGHAYFDAGGRFQRLVGISTDVTAREQAEEALRVAHARLALALMASGAGAWDWDILSGKLEWSDELFRLFGLDSAQTEATFDTWRQIMHPDDRQAAEENVNRAIRDHTQHQSEYRVVLPSGETRWISAVGDVMYDEQGHALRMAGLCFDLTARKLAEELIRKNSEDLRARNEDLERFNRAMVDRELRMIELKNQVNDLCVRSGQPPPYARESGPEPSA